MNTIHRRIFLLILLFVFFPFTTSAQTSDISPRAVEFQKSVNSLLSGKCFKGVDMGIRFYSLDRKTVLFDYKGDELRVPASNMKLVTTAAALNKVGPDFRFRTRVYTTGLIKNRVLKGNLYLKGFGDPHLVTEYMWVLVNQLKQLPLDKIDGDVYMDDTYFDGTHRISTWKRYTGPEAYLAPLGALSFNFNTVAVHVAPGKRKGQAPLVVVDPQTEYTKVTNSAVTTRNRRRGNLIVNRLARDGVDEIVVSGTLPTSVARKTYYLNITDPTAYTGHVFLKNLVQAGVEVTGKLKKGSLPQGALQRLEHESVPLAEILRGLNKFSNNFVAEQIVRVLGAREFGPPGSTENGVQILQKYLVSLGIAKDTFTVLDGSGLSRQNRLTPGQLVRVLEDMYSDLSVFPEFISALAVMGLDGSVEERMTRVKGAQRIRAKTGTLNHVSALSGYVQSKDGEKFAFSMLMNDLKCSNGKAQRLQDAILKRVLEFSRK